MTTYATLADATTSASLQFFMDKDWQPKMPEEGQIFFPVGYGYAVKSTDGKKGIAGTFTVVTHNDTDDTTLRTMLLSDDVLTLTLPNGTSYNIITDPGQEISGTAQFSLMGWLPLRVWTISYFQAP